jgi:hypothetical protein
MMGSSVARPRFEPATVCFANVRGSGMRIPEQVGQAFRFDVGR